MSFQPLVAWRRMRDSLWFLPSMMTLGAMVLAFALVRLDTVYLGARLAGDAWWLFGGAPDGARGLLATIAGSVITVAGVVFSITIVALQLASTQFTPRVLQNFMRDRGNQVVLGVFIGTFAYTLLVLRTVRSADETGTGEFVPFIAVTVAIAFGLLSMAVLIYYLQHVTGWIEASSIIDRVTDETLRQVHARYPIPAESHEAVATSDGDLGAAGAGHPPRADAATIFAHGSGYLEALDDERILELAARHDVVVRLEYRTGDFVLEETPLYLVWPRASLGPELEDDLRDAIVLGHRRTIRHDPGLGILQLSDIGVKALSPALNDPTTAMLSIDRLGQIVAEFAGRRFHDRSRRDEDGTLRVFGPAFRFEDAADLAFSQIRRYGQADPAVLGRLAHTLVSMGSRVGPGDRAVLRRLLDDIARSAELGIEHEHDRMRLSALLDQARRDLA